MTVPKPTKLRSFFASAIAWDAFLALLTLVPAVVFTALFFPGRANVDIGNQYAQATGDIPFSDWHPPVMSAVWRVLISITGAAGSLFVLQVVILALACWALGVIVHRWGAPRWVSLLGPAIMATPWVVSQMTTMWKDTQMAVAMLLAVVLLIITRFVPKTWLLWIPALVLLVYAFGLRKNAIFAIVPIAVYIGYLLVKRLRGSRRFAKFGGGAGARFAARRGIATAVASLLVLVVLGAGLKATDAAIASQEDVQATGQISQIFLDDVMFSVPNGDLQDSDAPAELKDKISTARDKCLEKGEIWDAYWNCYGKGETGEPFSPIAHQEELKDLWLTEVITHPIRYAKYRAAVFSFYFFSSVVEYWPAEWHGAAEDVGIEQGDAKADYIVKPYVEDFALDTFPMLFKPWFWTLLAGLLLVFAYRARTRETTSVGARVMKTAGTRTFWPEITMLSTSALFYVFGYFPIVPSNHFRYTFWPALAVTTALLFVLAMWRSRKDSVPVDRTTTSAPGETP
ncbi:glucosyltransferase domain-containing protein [Brevibacterium zhoupengii]|uniref:glucosyltransferase domain-containing protein n=1 Tax=Brevibacterium zhoupengii TaxID=2898795 RepID=UPI001F09FE12|nr:glucosyltransferase domain-containing protein [Brevibacterium zhoupengii]